MSTDEAQVPTPPVPGWCLVERKGARVPLLGGYVTEITIGAAPFLELKIPNGDGGWRPSIYLNAHTAVAAITPVDEATATAKAVKQWSGKG